MPRSSQHSRHRVAIAAGVAVLGMFVLVSALSCVQGERCFRWGQWNADATAISRPIARESQTILKNAEKSLRLSVDTIPVPDSLVRFRTAVNSALTYQKYLQNWMEVKKFKSVLGIPINALKVSPYSKIWKGKPFAYAPVLMNGSLRLLSVLGDPFLVQVYDFSRGIWEKVTDTKARLNIDKAQLARAYAGAIASMTSLQRTQYELNTRFESEMLGRPVTYMPARQFQDSNSAFVDVPFKEFVKYLADMERKVCGNAVVEQGEACDDGNTKDQDGCSASCQKETVVACTKTLANANFETTVEGGDFGSKLYKTLDPGSTELVGWSIVAASDDRKKSPNPSIEWIGRYWQAAKGEKSVELNGNDAAGIRQTFATVKGKTYVVSFALAGNPEQHLNPPMLYKLTVSAGTTKKIYEFDPSLSTIKDLRFRTETFTFVAEGTETTLAFTSLNVEPDPRSPNAAYGSLYGPVIDDVGMSAYVECR